MEEDLEDELMDLTTNESAYLPQAAHSRPPATAFVAAQPDSNPRAPSERDGPSKPSLSASLLGSFDGRGSPLRVAALSALPSPPVYLSAAPSVQSSERAPLKSSEEELGWYEQVEMMLATAESRYHDWVDSMETQGSDAEEELRRADIERAARRKKMVAQLKVERREAVRATLIESSRERRGATNTAMDVDQLMDKLAFVVDESTKQLTLLRREATWTRLAEDLPQTERDYVAKGTDEMFKEKLKYKRDPDETKRIIEQHLKDVFRLQLPTRNGMSVGRTMSHSLGQTLREFAEIFHSNYGDTNVKAALTVHGGGAAAKLVLPLAAADVNHFASILVQILLYKYPEIPRAWSTSVVHRCVIDALFEHLQPTLHALYIAAFEQENAFLGHLLQRMRSKRLEHFGVNSVFRLDGSWRPAGSSRHIMRDANDLQLQSLRQYEQAISRMNALSSHRSPWVKAEIVAAICKDIDQRIKEFYLKVASENQPTPTSSETNMTADDLSAVLAFLIASSPALCSHLATQLALLGSFMASEAAMGEEGFAIATFWTAVNHLCHLS